MDISNISEERAILYVAQNFEDKELVLQILSKYPGKIIKAVETLFEYVSPNFQKVEGLIVKMAREFPTYAYNIVETVIGKIPHREISQSYVYAIFANIINADDAIKIAEIAIEKKLCYPQNLVAQRPALAISVASLDCCTPADISAIMRMNSSFFKDLKIIN